MPMYPPTFIEKIEKLVAKGETQNALKELNQFPSTKLDPALKNQLILLTAQWHHYQRGQVENIKPNNELNKELNRINKAILSVLQGNIVQIDDSPKRYHSLLPKKKRWIWIFWIIGLIIALFIMFLYYFFWKIDFGA